MRDDDNTTATAAVTVRPLATVYRLKLHSPLWPRPAYTKWQGTRNFDKALTKAAELGITATVEPQNVKLRHSAPAEDSDNTKNV